MTDVGLVELPSPKLKNKPVSLLERVRMINIGNLSDWFYELRRGDAQVIVGDFGLFRPKRLGVKW